MIRRTTIEIDEELLARAKRALGATTTRATVEQALRQAADAAEDIRDQRATRQRRYLGSLDSRVDVMVLRSTVTWG
ncbi:MAG TPA: type II toxin-antitoxin system VapB family antitoxin [Mycobacteriales bacterium]|nr:type II toxin-antitoxin system VapB family antitoxin [Mycobacteriales bacterium]